MSTENNLRLAGRIWIEKNGERLIGKGRVELLERIKASGSIRQAALQMKMSYRQAWDLIKDMNERLDSPVIISTRGGKGGGNAVVTEKGEQVIAKFHLLHNNFLKFVEENLPLIDL
ncbi:MAG: ModE family transcriptional regulator [Daejeonella sp.]|nr:ModE family transcriptional regulator [Daejeonella sp.]